MAKVYEEQATAVLGDKTLDPWYKRMLLKRLNEEFGEDVPETGKTAPAPVTDPTSKPNNSTFLAGLSGFSGNTDENKQISFTPYLSPKQDNQKPNVDVMPFFDNPLNMEQPGLVKDGEIPKRNNLIDWFLDGLRDPRGRNKYAPLPGAIGGNAGASGFEAGFGMPGNGILWQPDWQIEREAAGSGQFEYSGNRPNSANAGSFQGGQHDTTAEVAEQQLRKHISEGRYDLVRSILGHSRGREALEAIGVDVGGIAEEAEEEKRKHPDYRNAPFWENMEKDGRIYAIASKTPSGEQIFIAPGYNGTLNVYKKWIDGSVTQVGGPYDSVQSAQSDISNRWDSILNGPTLGKVFTAALGEGFYSLGANLGRPILDQKNVGKYSDPFAEAQKIYDNNYIYNGHVMKVIDDYFKNKPPAEANFLDKFTLQSALPILQHENPFLQKGNKLPVAMLEDAENYYREQAIIGIKKFIDKGFSINNLEYDPIFGVQPIPPGTSEEGRNYKYMKLLHRLGIVDDTIMLAAEVMYNLSRAQQLNDERKTNNWWLQTAGNVTSGVPSFAAGLGLTVLDPAVGILYNVASGYGSNANEATMEGASYDKATEYALWNIPLNVATSLGPGKGGSKFLRAVVDLGSPMLQRIGGNLIKKGVYQTDMPIFGEGGVLDAKQMLDISMQAAAFNVFSNIIGKTSGKAREYLLKKLQNNETPDFDVAYELLREDAKSNDAEAKRIIENIDALEMPENTAGDAEGAQAGTVSNGLAQGDTHFLDGLLGRDKPLTPEEKTALAAGIKPQDAAGEAAALRAGLGLDEEQAKHGTDDSSSSEDKSSGEKSFTEEDKELLGGDKNTSSIIQQDMQSYKFLDESAKSFINFASEKGRLTYEGKPIDNINGIQLMYTEKKTWSDLLDIGNDVDLTERTNAVGVKSPDSKLNGTITELKAMTGSNPNTAIGRVEDCFKKPGVKLALLDVRVGSITAQQAKEIIRRCIGANKIPPGGTVIIWTNEGFVSYSMK